jgi:uncharacterized protein YoxC
MIKDSYLYIGIAIILLSTFIYFVTEQNKTNKFINDLQNKERENIKELQKKIDILTKERIQIIENIDSLKKYIDKKDIQLNTNIQRINNKKDAQIRNVSDSSSIALLKLLLPK